MGELRTLPVSFKVEGKRIVIIGGGDEALNKVRLAVKTTASVVIIASHIEVDFSPYPVEIHERAFQPSDLDGAALVFIGDEGPDGEAAKLEGRRRGIPVNVVDVPHECDFYTPSLIDQAPIFLP